jgi:hypothetical protein
MVTCLWLHRPLSNVRTVVFLTKGRVASQPRRMCYFCHIWSKTGMCRQIYVSFGILTTVNTKNAVFLDVTSCSLVELRCRWRETSSRVALETFGGKTATLVLGVEGFFRNVVRFLQPLFAVRTRNLRAIPLALKQDKVSWKTTAVHFCH